MSRPSEENDISWYGRSGAPKPRQPTRTGAARRPAGMRELQREVTVMRRHSDARAAGRRRLMLLGGVGVILIVVVVVALSGGSRSFAPPTRAQLAGLSLGPRIIAVADSQLGYATTPSRSYCNKFTAYWHVGASAACEPGTAAEEWCADFAAWAWRHAGVDFSYGYGAGDLNAGAVSFYEWGVEHGHWHPATAGFRPAAGDVAVYGLSLSPSPTATHVALVTASDGTAGPDVINGDGDRTGYSVVESGEHELRADTGRGGGSLLAGYVSP